MKRLALITVIALAVVLAAGCSSGSSKGSSSATTTPKDWDAAALKVADGLKAKLVAAKSKCTDYFHSEYSSLSEAYKKQSLPVPAASTNCAGTADEDLTTEVFADADAKEKFVQAKRKLLCEKSAEKKLDFPGFPYVDGGTWIFEPDDMSTAVATQKILGGTVKNADCKGL